MSRYFKFVLHLCWFHHLFRFKFFGPRPSSQTNRISCRWAWNQRTCRSNYRQISSICTDTYQQKIDSGT